MRKNFDYPTQVVFIFNMGDYYERCSGIAYHNEVICGCCGNTFNLEDEFYEIEIEKELPWVNLIEEISPEEDYGKLEDSCDEEERE